MVFKKLHKNKFINFILIILVLGIISYFFINYYFKKYVNAKFVALYKHTFYKKNKKILKFLNS